MPRLVVFLWVLVNASPVAAQQAAGGVSATGIVFVAPGVRVFSQTPTVHFGGGGEFVWPNGFGVGFDVGYIAEAERLDQPEEGQGIFSVGLIYEFDVADNPDLKPYVRGGISGLFSEVRQDGLMHLGGGVNWWAGDRWGLKFDVRDHFLYTFHVLEFGFGVLIRGG